MYIFGLIWNKLFPIKEFSTNYAQMGFGKSQVKTRQIRLFRWQDLWKIQADYVKYNILLHNT